MTRSSRTLLINLTAFSTLFSSSCKTPGGSQALSDTAAAGTASNGPGLDVNDVSLLFPLPGTMDEAAKMLSLSALNADGKPLVSEALFKDVIGHFKYDTTIDGVPVKFNSGAEFVLDLKQHPHNATFKGGNGPYNNYAEWRVIGVRYDPCAPTPTFNLLGKASPGTPTAFDPAKCLPQLRLTAQPVITGDRMNPDLVKYGQKALPHVADYSMHLLFELTEPDARAMYQDLVAYRGKCGDLTSGMPLGPHPCLVAEAFAGSYGGPNYQALASLVQKYAKKLATISSMATSVSTDPWVFMNGLVEGDTFKHVPITAVHKTTDIHKNAKGAMLEPFYNGYFQMASFLQVGTQKANSNPVTPQPAAGSVNHSFAAEFRLASDPSIRSPDLTSQVNKIENPEVNDFFSTDCVSCHGAAELSARTTQMKTPDRPVDGKAQFFADSLGDAQTPLATPLKSLLQQKYEDASAYKVGNGYTNIVAEGSLSTSRTTTLPYAFVHFGYLGRNVALSIRVANESGRVAKMANTFYGGGRDPKPACPTEQLRSCMASFAATDYSFSDGAFRAPLYALNAVGYCLLKICPQRAKELKPALGTFASHAYEVTEDLIIPETEAFPFTPPAVPMVVAKGTVIIGRLLPEEQEGLPYKQRLELAEFVSAKSADGTRTYDIRTSMPVDDVNAAKLKPID